MKYSVTIVKSREMTCDFIVDALERSEAEQEAMLMATAMGFRPDVDMRYRCVGAIPIYDRPAPPSPVDLAAIQQVLEDAAKFVADDMDSVDCRRLPETEHNRLIGLKMSLGDALKHVRAAR